MTDDDLEVRRLAEQGDQPEPLFREPFYDRHGVTVHAGDCLDVLATMADDSVDAVVCDPPYGLEFMGKEWDRFAGAVTDRDFKGFVLSQQRTRNVKCPDCQKWAYDHPGRLCECGGVRRAQGSTFQNWCEQWARECLRVLRPGGYIAAFGGTRTYHRMACAIEDAGFEIRDSLTWLYGSGFPKSLDVSKAIDKRGGRPDLAQSIAEAIRAARERRGWTIGRADAHFCGGSTNWTWFEGRNGVCRPPSSADFARIVVEWPELASFAAQVDEARREVIGERMTGRGAGRGDTAFIGDSDNRDVTAPATDAARQWAGWGTALKPAQEPIVLARKPLDGTVAANVLAHGTGGLNVDACRVGMSEVDRARIDNMGGFGKPGWSRADGTQRDTLDAAGRSGPLPSIEAKAHAQGRWPTNVLLSHSGTALYALRRDVPEQVVQTIRAYYGVDETVREVRDGFPGDALGPGQASVLLPGMRECCAQGRPCHPMGDDELCHLRDGVRDISRVGPQRAPEVLLGAVSGQGEPREDESSRQGAHGRVAGEDGQQSADGRTVEPVEGRPVRVEGVRARHGAAAPDGDAGADRADGREERLHRGTSSGGGGRDRSDADDGRRGAPRERGEVGQPAGEPDRDTAGGSLGGAPGDRAEVPHAASGGGATPGGERRLAVPAGSVPHGWLKYFEYLGEREDCADVCVPGCPVAELDAQSGNRRAGSPVRGTEPSHSGGEGIYSEIGRVPFTGHADQGGASRFFPVFRWEAKAPTAERPQVAVPPKLRLRADLTDERRTYVLAELTKAGVDVA